MATLNDSDLKTMVSIITSLHGYIKPTSEHAQLKEKIISIITHQPDPVPYCSCNVPKYNYKYTTPFCELCYGVPSNFVNNPTIKRE